MSHKRKVKRSGQPGRLETIPILNPNAAGMDIGADEIYVAVPADRDRQPIQSFGTFTSELGRLSEWLQQCRIETVAIEATGVYWIPVYQILESCGFEVCLVNARYFQNVPGRKTDVSDCQWVSAFTRPGYCEARSDRHKRSVCCGR